MDLNESSHGNYKHVDSLAAERKALTLITIWAVMANRYELVKVLWKYSDHPVHTALLISMFYERLSYNVMDINTKAEMKVKAVEFAAHANGVLDKCYNEDISQAYNVLRESTVDYDYMTAVDLAASAQLKQFMAHPCCQKWLTTTFQGHIRLREITWGFFTMPVPLKILLCSFLVFPMYLWVRFKEDEEENGGDGGGEDGGEGLEEEFDIYDSIYGSKKNIKEVQSGGRQGSTSVASTNPFRTSEVATISGFVNTAYAEEEDTELPKAHQQKKKASHFATSSSNKRREVFVKRQPPLWRMVQMMWCSPITKFYTSQGTFVLLKFNVCNIILYFFSLLHSIPHSSLADCPLSELRQSDSRSDRLSLDRPHSHWPPSADLCAGVEVLLYINLQANP